MHDTLSYFSKDPVHRKYHQNNLTFAMLYHYNENFLLPLSHDEVVHGKGSLLGKMPGDEWQRFANLRCLLAYQWLFPGKKLLMMGSEFGQGGEWNANSAIDWWLLYEGVYHRGIQQLVEDLNALYASNPPLWRGDFDPRGFSWIDCSDNQSSVFSFLRTDPDTGRDLVIVMNLTPVLRHDYRVGFPQGGFWRERLNTDAGVYGGSNQGNTGGVHVEDFGYHGRPNSARLTLPPLGVLVFEKEG
jgi:1,4-alpha-glucan branching enzyme